MRTGTTNLENCWAVSTPFCQKYICKWTKVHEGERLQGHLKWPRPGNSSHQQNGEINHARKNRIWHSNENPWSTAARTTWWIQVTVKDVRRHKRHTAWLHSKNEPGKSHPRCFVSERRLPLVRIRRQLWVVPYFLSGLVSMLRKSSKPYLRCVYFSGCVLSIKS